VKISTQKITVIKSKTTEKVLEVDLKLLKYKVTTFSFFTEFNEQEYRFDGLQVLDIKRLIENYLLYRKITEPEQLMS